MPKQERHKTQYPGVSFIVGQQVGTGKPERVFYIHYRRDGKLIEEKAGRQYQDAMTAARAATLRGARIKGEPSNQERRDARRAQQEAEAARWTFNRLWAAYQENRPDLKGLAQDASRYRLYIEPRFGDREPGELVALDFDRLRLTTLKGGKSPQTVKSILALMRRLVRFGVAKGFIAPLAFQIEMPSVDNEKTEDLNPDQLARLLKAIDEDPHPWAGPMMKLALFSGMRKSEMLRLQWANVDFQRGFIRLVNPKGGRDQQIPLNDTARQLLQSLPRTTSAFVFPGLGDGQRREIRRPIERIRQKAGLPEGFRPLHGLRHVYASMLASSGQVDMYTLQKLLTHKSPQMTARYAHLRDESLKRAADLAGEIVGQAAKPY